MKKNIGLVFMSIGVFIGIFILSFYITYNSSNKVSITESLDKNEYKEFMFIDVKDNSALINNSLEVSINNTLLVTKVSKEGKYNYEKIFILSDKLSNNKIIDEKIENNEVVIGKAIDMLSYKVNGEKHIKLANKEYKVKEVLDKSEFAYKVFLGKEDFKNEMKDNKLSRFNFIIIEKNITNDKLEKLFDKVNYNTILLSEDIVSGSIFNENSFYIVLTIFAISFINICNFSALWIGRRGKEFALYKALGAKNKDVFLILFKDILIVSSIAMVMNFLIQFIIIKIINNRCILNFYLEIKPNNIAICTILILAMSFLSVIPSFINTLKIEPAIILKEE